MTKKPPAVKINWQSSKDSYLSRATLSKDGRFFAEIPKAVKGQELFSLDNKFIYFPGGGVTHFNGVWQVNLQTGVVKIYQPQFMKSVEPWDQGVIIKWADGNIKVKYKDFKNPDDLLEIAKKAVAKEKRSQGTSLKSGETKDFFLNTSYYQFFIVLGDTDGYEDHLDAAGDQKKFAALEGNLVLVKTTAHMNIHPVKIVYGASYSFKEKPSEIAEFKVKLDVGQISFYVLFPEADEICFKLKKGSCKIRVSCYNSGEDPTEKMLKMPKTAFSKLENIERYVIEILES